MKGKRKFVYHKYHLICVQYAGFYMFWVVCYPWSTVFQLLLNQNIKNLTTPVISSNWFHSFQSLFHLHPHHKLLRDQWNFADFLQLYCQFSKNLSMSIWRKRKKCWRNKYRPAAKISVTVESQYETNINQLWFNHQLLSSLIPKQLESLG